MSRAIYPPLPLTPDLTPNLAPRHAAVPRGRRVEVWAAGIALFLQSGALFPVLMMGSGDALSPSQMSHLRLLGLPAWGIALWLVLRHRDAMRIALQRNIGLAMLMALPVLSVFWSISPSLTLRRSVALLMTMLLGYALALRFTPRQLLELAASVLAVSMVLSLAMAALLPHVAFMPGESTLRGAFTHKNGLGRMAALSLFFSVLLIADRAPRLRRMGLLQAGPALACLVLSQSATALLTAGVGLIFARFYTLLARRGRLGRALLVLIVLQLVAVLLFWLVHDLVPFLDALGKDATLTGRVPLWAELAHSIAARPWTGYGYEAFWSPGSAEAWRVRGAIVWEAPNAHSGWREMLLAFGVPGTLLLAAVMLRAMLKGAALHCARPDRGWLWINAFFALMLTANLTESLLMMAGDMTWVLLTAAIAMISLHRPAPPAG